jgi:hypothetical protein
LNVIQKSRVNNSQSRSSGNQQVAPKKASSDSHTENNNDRSEETISPRNQRPNNNNHRSGNSHQRMSPSNRPPPQSYHVPSYNPQQPLSVVAYPVQPSPIQQPMLNQSGSNSLRNSNNNFTKRTKRRGSPVPANVLHPVIAQDESLNFLKDINPTEFDCDQFAKFYVIKSYSEDDVHKSIKYSLWTSTDNGNSRLDEAYCQWNENGPVYLFFSVNASGQFVGVAQMMSPLDFNTKSDCWHQDKWNGRFSVKWIFIKDIPNSHLRHIRLSNNDNKPVTNSRDTQEILLEPGKELLKIFRDYKTKTSILDDFDHYNKEEEERRMKELPKKTVRKVVPNQLRSQPQSDYRQPSALSNNTNSNSNAASKSKQS